MLNEVFEYIYDNNVSKVDKKLTKDEEVEAIRTEFVDNPDENRIERENKINHIIERAFEVAYKEGLKDGLITSSEIKNLN